MTYMERTIIILLLLVSVKENKRRILELETYSTYSGITKNIFVKLTIINNLFEMWIPIVSSEHIQQDKIEEFTNYMLFLKEN